jgi:hypothetical protein
MQELSFTLSIEGWWLYLNIPRAMTLELHLGVVLGLALIIGGIYLFKRARNQIKIDRSLALLGAVYANKPGPKEHGPRFYKRRRRGL